MKLELYASYWPEWWVYLAQLAAHDDDGAGGAEPLRDELPVHGPGRHEGGDGDPAGAGTNI